MIIKTNCALVCKDKHDCLTNSVVLSLYRQSSNFSRVSNYGRVDSGEFQQINILISVKCDKDLKRNFCPKKGDKNDL